MNTKTKLPIYRQTISKNLYARYYKESMVDGSGVRNSLYVSGCLFNCKGCYNKSIQDFNAGEPFTKEIHDSIVADLKPNHINGITLLGGEPFLNLNIILPLVRDIRKTYGKNKDIWSWTGFTWEELMEIITIGDEDSIKIKEYLENLDILVDGRFEQSLFEHNLTFRGSRNQRIIDVPKTLSSGEIVLWKNGEYK